MPRFSGRRMLLAAVLTLAGASAARADEWLEAARSRVAAATQPAARWDGPTSGPKAVPGKLIVFIAADMNNGGVAGVARGVTEAAKAIGWTSHLIDGGGTVEGRAAALAQALALKPSGIVVGGFDTTEQRNSFATAALTGTPLVGWHSGEKPGPNAVLSLFANVTTAAEDVAEISAMWAVADSDGRAGVVIFTDSKYRIAVYKARMMEAVVRRCGGCKLLSFEDIPIAESATRMPAAVAALRQRFGERWTHMLAINDAYFDALEPADRRAGRAADALPKAVSAGDGSPAAYQRIRARRFQAGTVPEPLNLQGWQIVDEMNRAFALQPWSGYVPKVHLVTSANVEHQGGSRDVFEPDNGYRERYRAIWGR